jgi:hypothetical protein
MGMSNTASRRTHVLYAEDDDTLTVDSGASVKVYCIELAAVTDAATVFTIYDGDGTTVRGIVNLVQNTSLSWGCCHIADKGIVIKSNKANASCTIFHDSPGN